MLIKSADIYPYELQLKQSWHTYNDRFSKRHGWLIKLKTNTGLTGFGDCAPLVSIGTETTKNAYRHLTDHVKSLPGKVLFDQLEKSPTNTDYPAANFAIETALLDLLSQNQKLSLRHWLNPNAKNQILVNGMLGELNSNSIQAALDAASQGFKILKYKVGMNKLLEDIDLLKTLCRKLPDGVKLRLDANGAWDISQAGVFIQAIGDLPIESLEEPLKIPSFQELKTLQEKTHISLALDESLSVVNLDELITNKIIKRIIIKPMALGGLITSMSLAEQAAASDIESLVTSSIESAIGLQATAQLAAAIDLLNNKPMTHGLAVSEWIKNNLATTPEIIQGKLQFTDNNGLGVTPGQE